MSAAVLLTLAWRFFVLSLLAIGGANAVVPEIHRMAVEVERWMSAEEFAALFAIANTAPGPNLLVVTLVGWRVAGIAGAVVATVAFVAPTACTTYAAFSIWNRFRAASWRQPVQNGLASVMVGLLAASAFLLADAAVTGRLSAAIAVASALIAWRTKLNPLWFFAAAAVLGAAFLA